MDAIRKIAFPVIAALVFVVDGGAARAQPASQELAAGSVDEILVVGSRRRDRSAGDSPVPVDVIGGEDLQAQGDSDMDSLLAALVPSYNVAQEPISDAGTFVRPATLRSLPPDATLVLVNGKRRHRAAVIALLSVGVSSGSQGPDLSVIPAIALERVEVLRDGASAQYGSDAIAGIMNFVLKEDNQGFTLDTRYGSHYEGDGDAVTVAGNAGFALSDAGFANISFEFKESEPTDRAIQRPDAQALIDAGNSHVRQPTSQIWGAPRISDDFKVFGNFGIDLGNGAEAYMFGNWAQRQVEGGFYFRNPHTRDGVFRGPVLEDGTPTVKVADLIGDLSGNCPVVRIVDNVADPAALSAISADPNCYSLIERFPGGFTPQFGGFVDDISLAGGVRGELDSGWFYDLSAVAGNNVADYYIYDTINPQLLTRRNEIPTWYDAGAYEETDRVVNFDLSRQFFPAAVESVNVAAGLEYRDETFRIRNGDPNSWFIDPNLARQGFGVGSNGFPGFRPDDAGENTVRAWGGYVDVESNLTESLLLGGAVRYESYADFGDTLDGKIAARLQVTGNLAVRGAVSTGFRVPTAGQANLRNVTTEVVMGSPSDIATLPPTNPIAREKGARPLKPEESVNTTLGLVLSASGWNVTLDWYDIEISDRISFTSRFVLTPGDIENLLAAGVPDATSFSSVRFFTNEQTVTASGVDLVATLPFELGGGDSTFTFVANWSEIRLTEFNPDFTSGNRKLQIENGRPDLRYTATWTHEQGPWRFLARTRYYGEFYDAPTNDPTVAYFPEPGLLFDFEAGYEMSDSLSLRVGMQNAFDEYPSTNPHGDASGLIYPEQSPFGFNGGFYYLRATWNAF